MCFLSEGLSQGMQWYFKIYELKWDVVYIDNFCVEVFEKTISRTDVIDHSFERKFNGVYFKLC